MTVSDKERREAARRVRRIPEKGKAVAYTVLLHQLGLECHPDFEYGTVFTPESVIRLADLIEPGPERTCHFVYDEDEDEFKCDACGYFVTQSEPLKEEYHVTQLTAECFVYFPFCGAMVVGA